jgi:hypothetical protein
LFFSEYIIVDYQLIRKEEVKMSTIAELTAEALSFPSKSRAILADVLLDSLNDTEVKNYDEVWLAEAKRRDREITENKVSCKTHSEVLERARKIIR